MALQFPSIPSRSGSVIAFDQAAIYNSPSSPSAGAISYDFTGAAINTSVYLFYNAASLTLPAGSVTVAGTYNPNNLNMLELLYLGGSVVSVRIHSANSSGYTNPETIYTLSADVSTTGTTGISIGMNIPILASTKYAIQGFISHGMSGVGGIDFGTGWTAAPTQNEVRFHGRTNAVNAFTSMKTDTVNGYNAVFTGTNGQFGTIASSNNWCDVNGQVTGGASDATLTILFAAHTSGQTATIYKKGTYLKVTKI